ncbi:MAG: ABC transporter ATP-binding protein [Microbacterium sp.]|uniref:ABC transporter ATP-binding protein n=1 Tax=Microbacterium sp. TaxID=51671 RepID=UPI001E060CD4|nr:ABC transporter ATP-binding protein [Microbacterium sp.]MBW8764595.1 ABC transporter ATP-binding protein [Microbacterium sp.]
MSAPASAELHTSSATGELVLEVEGLTTGYGRTVVVRDLSLSVPAGGVTAVLGPNGAGKTTLLRAVCGLLPVSKGRVRLFGEDVTKVAPFQRFARGLCHVPEGRGIFRGLTVRENLKLQAGGRDESRAIELAASAFPILRDRLGQTAGTLSGGQQQMLAMASAYVRNPRLVLVDEASLGLAPIVVDEIFAFLAGLPERGSSILLVDQFAPRALAIASTAYVMRRGEIAFSGTGKELLEGDLFSQYVQGSGSDTT